MAKSARKLSSFSDYRKSLTPGIRKLQKYFDQLPFPAAFLEPQTGKFVSVNDSFVSSLEYTKDELIGKSSKIIFKKNSLQRELKLVKYGHTNMLSEKLPIRLFTRSGRGLLAEITIHKFIVGNQSYFFMALKDVTKYLDLIDSMMDGYVKVSMSGKIMEYNASFKKMLGYSEEELKKLTNIDITPAKWHKLEKDIVSREILKHGYSSIYEKEYRRKDGQTFPVELRTFLARDRTGQPEAMWAIVRDITIRKGAQLSEQRAHFLLNAIIENVSDAVYYKDINGKYIYFNTAAGRIAGKAVGDVLGKDDSVLFSEKEARVIRDTDKKILKTGKAITCEEEIAGVDGKRLILLTTKRPIANEKLGIKGIFGITKDLTERKRLELDLLQSKRFLEEERIALRRLINLFQEEKEEAQIGRAHV